MSKKIALTAVLLSSPVMLNGCDWLDSKPCNTPAGIVQAPAANTSSNGSTEQPKIPEENKFGSDSGNGERFAPSLLFFFSCS